MSTHVLLLAGRATEDAQTLKSKNDNIFAKFTIAVNEYLGKEKGEKAYFYDILVFGKSAPKVIEKIKKGDNVYVQGKPEADAYISKKDKSAKAQVTVIASEWQVIK